MIRASALLIIWVPLLVFAGFASAEQVPAYILALPESVTNVFVADTGETTFYRFERTPKGLTLRDQDYMSIGQNGVGKQRAWDRKTPLGLYFVVDQLDTSRLHEKYGVTAFPLDYPNVWDRRSGRGGDGIWVHGVLAGDGRRPPLDTDGCLALPNDALLDLEDKFLPLVSPVIITRRMEWREAASRDALRSELENALRQWVEALASGDVYAYLSMYADEFRYRGLTFNEWASFRAQTLEQRGEASIAVDDLLLLADPEEQGLYLSRFRQTVTDQTTTSVTTKRLYWRRDDAGNLEIIAEDNG